MYDNLSTKTVSRLLYPLYKYIRRCCKTKCLDVYKITTGVSKMNFGFELVVYPEHVKKSILRRLNSGALIVLFLLGDGCIVGFFCHKLFGNCSFEVP